MCIITASRG
jgi:hypothetical protein